MAFFEYWEDCGGSIGTDEDSIRRTGPWEENSGDAEGLLGGWNVGHSISGSLTLCKIEREIPLGQENYDHHLERTSEINERHIVNWAPQMMSIIKHRQ